MDLEPFTSFPRHTMCSTDIWRCHLRLSRSPAQDNPPQVPLQPPDSRKQHRQHTAPCSAGTQSSPMSRNEGTHSPQRGSYSLRALPQHQEPFPDMEPAQTPALHPRRAAKSPLQQGAADPPGQQEPPLGSTQCRPHGTKPQLPPRTPNPSPFPKPQACLTCLHSSSSTSSTGRTGPRPA